MGLAEPVRRNAPGPAPASTARRTASHRGGTRCHSSRRTGFSPSRSRPGAASATARPARSSRRWTVAARCSAVSVFPTPFAPSNAIAGRAGTSSSSSASTTRRTYGIRGTETDETQWLRYHYARAKATIAQDSALPICTRHARLPFHERPPLNARVHSHRGLWRVLLWWENGLRQRPLLCLAGHRRQLAWHEHRHRLASTITPECRSQRGLVVESSRRLSCLGAKRNPHAELAAARPVPSDSWRRGETRRSGVLGPRAALGDWPETVRGMRSEV